MYPFLRLALEMRRARRMAPLPLGGVHVAPVRCLPWDVDPWGELNNGRTLTLYDLGRLPLFQRTGLLDVCRARGWGVTMAGCVVRWRRRVRPLERLEMRSAAVGRDARFLYVHQTMWRDGEAASAAVYRVATVGPGGIVPPAALLAARGAPDWDPPLPDWIAAWAAAEAARPWPPSP
jgi:acyl-CoA thioesterase FadM